MLQSTSCDMLKIFLASRVKRSRQWFDHHNLWNHFHVRQMIELQPLSMYFFFHIYFQLNISLRKIWVQEYLFYWRNENMLQKAKLLLHGCYWRLTRATTGNFTVASKNGSPLKGAEKNPATILQRECNKWITNEPTEEWPSWLLQRQHNSRSKEIRNVPNIKFVKQ